MCKKQTSVSHSSTESEIISLDAVWLMDGIPALDLWDLVVEVLHSSSNQTKNAKEKVHGDVLRDKPWRKHTNTQTKTQIQHNDLELPNVDYVSSNVKSPHSGAMHYNFEDNEAVIKMIIKDRSPIMRHVSRTHWVALDWLFDRINLDPKIQIKEVDTKNQLADILTKAISHVMSGTIFSICSTLSISAVPAALKRWRKELWQSRSRRWAWFRTPRQALLQRSGILKASSQSLSLIASGGRPAAEDSNQNDAASSSQVCQSDAMTNDSARRLAATGTNQNLDVQASAKRPAAENSDIIDDLKWLNNYRRSRANL